ncbi:unnamed protein product [Clonostachys rosea]|uniref:Nephrocystin 3-like N-terminal domain-containing protein n=1 Tax=Bionectria ochroleuca TaxID=29856 RepID=A0ABY6ULE9_BIOOC|nr:unnamed protein product [Clonostachys rosea]
MGRPGWDSRVYRLRRLPHNVASVDEVARMISTALGIPQSEALVYSLASSSNPWESPPSKVATLQLKSVPGWIRDHGDKTQEWGITFAEAPGGRLILDTHFEGMTVLNDVNRTLHHTDCIALSGLASHPFGSWQPHGHDKTFMWLRDEAPRLITGARMILYGYDSQLIGSQSFQSISDIALAFIHQLNTGGWNLALSKSIVFLAHSLGGVVLKDAIVQMADRETVAPILNRVKGAIMFGVPSLGMYQSHLMAMTEGQSNEMLVQDLSRENGSAYLRHLNARFNGLSFINTMKIYWAYETKESATTVSDGTWAKDGSLQLLVAPDSATCHNNTKNNTITVPIDRDHSSMVKFSSGDRYLDTIIHILFEICAHDQSENSLTRIDGYQEQAELRQHDSRSLNSDVVSAENQEILQVLGQILKSMKDINEDLASDELHLRMDSIEEPFEDTFNWIFEMPLFCKWLQEGSGLFWINGKPGSGKSILMKHIYNNKQTWELLHDWRRSTGEIKEIKAGFFFHYRGTPLQKSFEGILRSLLLQLLDPHFKAFWERWGILTWLQEEEQNAMMRIEDLTKKLENPAKSWADATVGIWTPGELKRLIRKDQRFIASCPKQLARIAKNFTSNSKTPETTFISLIISEYKHCTQGQIPRLEKMLRLLLDQDIIIMDIILFFDALDEFDGHTDMISRFLKSLVCAPTSDTRVKLCFSSRPWKVLEDHFSNYPSISLQEHTRNDIELYAASKMNSLSWPGSSVLSLVPLIVTRANGVFLWVTLAVREILDAGSSDADRPSVEQMKQRLLQLPDDLQSFYELIIERIPKVNRRNTYALLELIIHKLNTQAVDGLWLAVMISGCSTFNDALKIFHRRVESQGITSEQKADILAWGGGLVEINHFEPQLMHQTVLEFATGLSFKKMVLGPLATVVAENGHSYFFKYLVTNIAYERPGRNVPVSEPEEYELLSHHAEIAYHAEQSEITTGRSQLSFIQSIPQKQLQNSNILPHDANRSADVDVLSFAALNGLTLCLRDWIEEHGQILGCVCRDPAWPLLRLLIFSPRPREFEGRYVDTAKVILENGFDLNKDPSFFSLLIAQIWHKRMRNVVANKQIPEPALHQLAALALEHGQNPNIVVPNFILTDPSASPLHIVPPILAKELVQHGADPNARDPAGRTPLDWVLMAEYNPVVLATTADLYEWRYQMVEILTQAGAEITSQQHKILARWLVEFEKRGFDVAALRGTLARGKKTEADSQNMRRSIRYKLKSLMKGR